MEHISANNKGTGPILYTLPNHTISNLLLLENKISLLIGRVLDKFCKLGYTTLPYFHLTTVYSLKGIESGIKNNTHVFKFLPCDQKNNFIRNNASIYDFQKNPERFFRNIIMMLQNGIYHTVRQNHPREEVKNNNRGAPILVILDPRLFISTARNDFAQHYTITSNSEINSEEVVSVITIPQDIIGEFTYGFKKVSKIMSDKHVIESINNLLEEIERKIPVNFNEYSTS